MKDDDEYRTTVTTATLELVSISEGLREPFKSTLLHGFPSFKG